MVISDTSCMIDGFTIALLQNLGKSGQSWDYDNRVQL